MGSSSSNNGVVRSCFPFTATQWQELESQAQVYKCMVSGTPVPSELLFTIRRSLDSSPLSPTFFFNNQAHQPIGWSRFHHMGSGRKIDPEPGRCRRTDGKKWRCSKEAYPDSKYCERHMHRGRNRSRKPVELLSSSSSNAANIPISSLSTSMNKNSFSSYRGGGNNGAGNEATNEPHVLYSPHFSSVKPPFLGLSPSSVDSAANFFLGINSQSHASGKDYKNGGSMFESDGELSPFVMGSSSSSLSQIKQSSDVHHLHDDDDDHHQPKKVMHRFLDERPRKDDEGLNWLKSEHEISAPHATRLSISVANPMHDFFTAHK